MNSIDMRFGATIGIVSIGVENLQNRGHPRGQHRRNTGGKNFPGSNAVGNFPAIRRGNVDSPVALPCYLEKRSSALPPK